jgi:hypothetical protein
MKKKTRNEISPEQYKKLFSGKETKAHAQALDIRKFEIELYWKRASYFWTFIGATMAGFLAVQAFDSSSKQDLSVILSCLGVVFSFAWFCVNRGSKYWQENWEKHVDCLEDDITGPLYKVVLSRNKKMTKLEKFKHLITGPSALSVSKTNQIISLYVTILWIILLFNSLPKFVFSTDNFDWFYSAIVSVSFMACIMFLWLGRSYGGGYYHTAELRKSRIKPDTNEIKDEEK